MQASWFMRLAAMTTTFTMLSVSTGWSDVRVLKGPGSPAAIETPQVVSRARPPRVRQSWDEGECRVTRSISAEFVATKVVCVRRGLGAAARTHQPWSSQHFDGRRDFAQKKGWLTQLQPSPTRRYRYTGYLP